MTFGTAIREALHHSDPNWAVVTLNTYRTCTDHCGHDLAHGVLVTDLLDRDQQDQKTQNEQR